MRLGIDRRVLALVAALVFIGCTGGVGVSNAQAEACANEQLRVEQPYGLGLPDCRAFEKVSPAAKGDGDIDNRAGTARASVSGEALVFASPATFAEPAGSLPTNHYLTRRGSEGWSTQSITPRYKAMGAEEAEFVQGLIVNPDLSKWLTLDAGTPLTSEAPAGYVNLYVGDNVKGSYQAVTTSPNFERRYEYTLGAAGGIPVPGGASTDLSHVVFQEPAAFTPNARPFREGENFEQLYEWTEGKLTLVDVPPEGAPPFPFHDYIGAPSAFLPKPAGNVWHAVSDDGSRVFFTASEGSSESGGTRLARQGQLYVREISDARTIRGLRIAACGRRPAWYSAGAILGSER